MNDSDAQRHFSSHHSSEWKLPVFMKQLTTPSWSVMSISERTCTQILSSPVAPPCTQASLTACRRRSLPWHHRQWKSRSSHHQSENTLSGSVAPFWHLFLLSNRCGSLNKNMTNPVHLSSTESASKFPHFLPFIVVYVLVQPTCQAPH